MVNRNEDTPIALQPDVESFKVTQLQPGAGLEYAKAGPERFRNYPAKKGGKHVDG